MKNKRNYFLGLLIFVLAFFTFGVSVYAIPDPDQPEVFLYGFGDDYDDDEFLTLYNTRTCYVALNNIPISERKNVKLTIDNNDIAQIQSITYNDDNHTAITAKIKGKKLGTAHIIASLTYKGITYTSKITTTVRESNYQIILSNDSVVNSEKKNIMNKNEKWKLKAVLVIGMAHRAGDISSKGVIWSSSNEKVLSVNNSGLVTAIGEGTASIIAKYKTEEGVIISNSYKIEVQDNNKKNNNNGNNGGKNNVNKNPQPVKSKTNTLNKVEISNVDNLKFESNEVNYNIEVENNIKEVEIKSTLTDAKSKYVDGYGNRKIELKEGNNKIEIRVQAENGDIKIYTFNITRKSDQYVKDIKISGYDLNFNYKITNYILKIEEEKELDINVYLTDDKNSYEIVGNENLKDGSIIKIIIKDKDKNELINYEIEIKKSSTTKTIPSKQKSNNYALPIAVFGIGVISITAAIIYKKKQSL